MQRVLSRVSARASAWAAVVLIALAVVPLGYLATRAAVRQHQMEEVLLRTEAYIAARQLGINASMRFHHASAGLLRPRELSIRYAPLLDTDDPRAILAAVDSAKACNCTMPMPVEFAFRTDLTETGTAVVGPRAAQARASALAEAARRHTPSLNDKATILLVPEMDSATGTLVFLSRMQRPGSRGYFGIGVDTAMVNAFILNVALFHDARAPSTVADTGGMKNAVAARFIDAHGRIAYATPEPVTPSLAATSEVDSWWGGWKLEASLSAAAAEHVLQGKLPASPVPYLALLMSLALLPLLAGIVLIWRMAELSRLRQDFASSVSHELRTPLTQILLYAETMGKERVETADERRRAVGVITREAHRLIHLVENVLRFSRAEHGRVALELRPIALAPLLSEVVAGFEPLAAVKGARIAVECAPDLVAQADDDALRRILINLLDNAVKYGPAGQQVVLAAERRDGIVRVAVRDEGPGIPIEDRERVWRPFVRLEQGANGTQTGGGIGLAIVSELAERLGARVGIESAASGGAEVYVELQSAR